MPKAYSLADKRTNILQPHLVRNRQPYSGPISSQSLNLFYDQFIMDIARLYKYIDDLNLLFDEVNELRSDEGNSSTPGYYYSSDINMTIYTQSISYNETVENYEVQSATPYYNSPLQFYKPSFISSQITFLRNKLYNLEKTINIE